jgi:hypothetical protein
MRDWPSWRGKGCKLCDASGDIGREDRDGEASYLGSQSLRVAADPSSARKSAAAEAGLSEHQVATALMLPLAFENTAMWRPRARDQALSHQR